MVIIMRNKFNYKESINNIKANLFDIYENQEEKIGLEDSEEQRTIRLNNFIELKNMALSFIAKIELLYEEDIEKKEYESNHINQNEIIDEKSNDLIDDSSNEYVVEEQSELTNEENSIENNDIEDTNNETTIEELPKFYLNCDFDRINFAYVPQTIYEKIKNYNGASVDDATEEFNEESSIETPQEENEIDNHFYKQDLEKTRGIIVRSDQYMKLALSRHRQAGVLEEAKNYRKEEVIKKQRENQKRELEKAELKFDL